MLRVFPSFSINLVRCRWAQSPPDRSRPQVALLQALLCAHSHKINYVTSLRAANLAAFCQYCGILGLEPTPEVVVAEE